MEGTTFQTQSESIGKITTALASFQSQAKGVKKTAENPFFHSKYAELSDVWDEIREPLTKNGLAVVQTFLGDSLVTTLAHTSGEWFRGYLKLTPIKANDPQAQGSAITYVRRYALQAITGIAPIDDDGNAASGKSHQTTTGRPSASLQVHDSPAHTPEHGENVHTSRFEVSDPIESKNKKGTFYRKAVDLEGASFFVFDDKVVGDLQVIGGGEATVEVDSSTKWPRIVRVVNGSSQQASEDFKSAVEGFQDPHYK
jgi:hypothetical protein